jgi:hypothetical protein
LTRRLGQPQGKNINQRRGRPLDEERLPPERPADDLPPELLRVPTLPLLLPTETREPPLDTPPELREDPTLL